MKTKISDLSATAIAPVIWGSTYLVTTEFLQGFSSAPYHSVSLTVRIKTPPDTVALKR